MATRIGKYVGPEEGDGPGRERGASSRREFLQQAALTGTGMAGLSLLLQATATGALPTGEAQGKAQLASLAEDAGVRWLQANPLAIQTDAGQNGWHAGHVNAVLALEDGAIVVGTDTGGVWVISSTRAATPLSDTWDNPDVTCLAFGPDGPRHIYAGCTAALYETDPLSAAPLYNWRQILSLPSQAGSVYRIEVLKEARLIVLACQEGVWWSPIPQPGGAFGWKQASGLPAGGYSGLALGPHPYQWHPWFPIGSGSAAPRSTVTALARSPNHLDLFVVGPDGIIRTTWWDANSDQGRWDHDWTPINPTDPALQGITVPPGSTVTAVARNPNHIDLFVVGGNGLIFSTWWDANEHQGRWDHGWFVIGDHFGVPPGSTVTAVARNPNHLDLFVVGGNGLIFSTWWDANADQGRWDHGWFVVGGVNVPGAIAVPPGSIVTAVARNPTHLDLFVVGGNGLIFSTWWDANSDQGRWDHGWFPISGIAVPAKSTVNAVARNPNHLDLFVVGGNGLIFSTWWDANTDQGRWDHGWFVVGGVNVPGAIGVPPGSTVTALARTPDHLDLFVVGGNGLIFSTWWDANEDEGRWDHGWFVVGGVNVPGAIAVPTGSTVTAVARYPDHLDLFVVGGNGLIFSAWWGADATREVVVAAIGSNPPAGSSGVFHGEWSQGALTMTRAAISGADVTKMYRTSVASCESQSNVVYAVSSKSSSPTDGEWIYAVLKSVDGGRSWERLITQAEGFNAPLESNVPDVAGGQGHYNNCIAVLASNPNVVLIGWRNGPWLSQDGGIRWRRPHTTAQQDGPHLHADLHAVYFDPTDGSGQRFYVCSDGGVVMSPDMGRTYVSDYNRSLQNLQFLSPSAGRGFWGMLNASYQVPGLIAGGLQDNGGAYCRLEPELTPWKLVIGGDGGSALFETSGHLLYSIPGGAVLAGQWNGQDIQPLGPVPIRGPKSKPGGLVSPVIDLVNSPRYRNAAQQLMYAVAAVTADVFGLFANGDGSDLHWEYVGGAPLPDSDYFSAVGSGSGGAVWVGTATGRLFSVLPGGSLIASVFEAPVVPRIDESGSIGGIVVQSDTLAFAIYNRGGSGLLLRFDGRQWQALGGGLPNQTFFAIDTDWTTTPKTLYAATDDRVYVSRDNGSTWQSASQGLPRRPHCADVRFVSGPNGARFLYLSTYGRSVWQAKLA